MLTQLVENLLNRNLAASPAARDLCVSLRGRRFAVQVELADFSIGVESLGDSLRLSQPAAPESEATVRGSPVNLLALAGPDSQNLIHRGDVRIEGDAELAQQYQRLLHLLRPDFTEDLSRLIGDAAAHRLSGFVQDAVAYGRRAASTTFRNTFEYLAHEKAELVPRAEAEALFHDIENLRDDVARLASRITQLESPS